MPRENTARGRIREDCARCWRAGSTCRETIGCNNFLIALEEIAADRREMEKSKFVSKQVDACSIAYWTPELVR